MNAYVPNFKELEKDTDLISLFNKYLESSLNRFYK